MIHTPHNTLTHNISFLSLSFRFSFLPCLSLSPSFPLSLSLSFSLFLPSPTLFQESEALDMMLGRLLNAGLVTEARELAALFEHDSPDLTIVLV